MINLRNSPFLWLALMLLISFRMAESGDPEVKGWLLILLWSICGICCVLSLLRYVPKHQFITSVVIGALIFTAGLIRFSQFNKDQFPGNVLAEPIYLQGIVTVDQVLKNKNSSVSLKCQRIFLSEDGDEESNIIEDKYLLVVIKSGSITHYFPGDILMVKGRLSAIADPLNPFSFDAKKYYKTIGIRHQMYCKGSEILVDSISVKSISRITAQWQTSLSTLVKNNISPQVAQLTNALVWGDRSDMDNDVRDAFADSGAMHVLSVSGMHVAIIYSMLFFFLGPPGSGIFMKRIMRFISYSLAILMYVGLTGACPAVMRAGLMIILFLFGKAMGWNTQIWNLLGFAAFMMMWINPYVWENVGFQLSFLAMAGILLFSKAMIRSLSFKQKLVHMIWEITVLSIVAQVFILPILLGQFHQFPLTFIISSLVAIPAGYLIVFGAILNVVLSFIGINMAWPLLDWTGQIFIQSMKWMGGLNPEMHFSLPPWSGIFLMAMAIFFTLALVFKWPRGKMLAYVCSGLTLITMGCHRLTQWSGSEMIIYHSYKGLVIDITKDGRCISLHDCDVPPESIEFASRGYRCHRDIIDVTGICVEQEFEENNIQYKSSLLSHDQFSILLWEGETDSLICVKNISHLIIEQCPDPDGLMEFIYDRKDMQVIIPAHLDRKLKKIMEGFLNDSNIVFHDIDQDGYLIIPL
ncbi:MAG TPA: ComEC/Rec2 family competence protein [Saprospiraceae bacterium]|nr:ComEC/Rec2 family competence protein [Saprospiraceae bacterium]